MDVLQLHGLGGNHATGAKERGRAFRERQKRYEEGLEKPVDVVRRQVQALEERRALWQHRLLMKRHRPSGSLTKLVMEYHRLFESGLQCTTKDGYVSRDAVDLAQHQESFVRCVMDPIVRIGDLMGPEVCLEQWRIYTAAHVSYRSQVRSIRVLGSEESPVFLVELSVFARWSRDTFRLMFPHAIRDESLVNRFIGKKFEYTAVNQYHFTPDGWISILQVGIDFVGSLVRCGVRVRDIAVLTTATTLKPHCTVQSS